MMKELIRTNDPVLLSYCLHLLKSEDIEPFVFDVHMSIMEGSIGILPRRVLVIDDEYDDARTVLAEADIELPDHK